MGDTNIPKVVYLNESKFRDAMLSLRRRGGAHQRAYDKACSLIIGLNYGVGKGVTERGQPIV